MREVGGDEGGGGRHGDGLGTEGGSMEGGCGGAFGEEQERRVVDGHQLEVYQLRELNDLVLVRV